MICHICGWIITGPRLYVDFMLDGVKVSCAALDRRHDLDDVSVMLDKREPAELQARLDYLLRAAPETATLLRTWISSPWNEPAPNAARASHHDKDGVTAPPPAHSGTRSTGRVGRWRAGRGKRG